MDELDKFMLKCISFLTEFTLEYSRIVDVERLLTLKNLVEFLDVIFHLNVVVLFITFVLGAIPFLFCLAEA